MRLKKSAINRLATNIVTSLVTKQLLQTKVETNKLIEVAEGILVKNMEDEQAIEDEAHRLMEQYKGQMTGSMDPQKMYTMMKKEVAKKKKFIL